MKYSYAFFKFLHSLYINLVQETLLNPSSGQEAVWSECKRLEYLHFTETAVDYMTEQKEVNKTLLRLYKDRLDHASTMEKTTMFSVKEHNLFINRSEEKWSAQKRLNEVEKKYFAQREQNENKNQRKVWQEFTQSYNDVYNQFYRGRLFNKYRESGLELNDAFYDLANMIGEAEYRRFESCKTLPSEERYTTMLNLMDNGEITCKRK
uniref:SJCHGC03229 protein n=1 Tax=Schistosoma japonicum TaxID=6182 RepID=Q5DGR4_SCHJA|nr:SJCHGC03229 protein [Schistosoma japonicum]